MNKTTKLGRALVAVTVAIGVAAVPAISMADQSTPDTAAVQAVSATAVIQKINKDSRVVTLVGPKGNAVDVKVGPNVNVDKLKIGQRVNATYYEEVAVGLHKPGDQAPKMTESVTERGGIAAQQTTVTAKVISVDVAENTVVLRGPSGADHSVKVRDPDLQAQLGKIKPGDSVDVTYTQAVAVSVEPAK